ncbi:MAG: glycosyl transferase [Blastocatellia bacterium]|nr:glycosyl transferase [Blastocatellia bacterium]MBL8194333.1 glycosyl transferase [Blastocatellia bacterium]
METIQVYVGATEKELIPFKILEYSIVKNTKSIVNVFPLYQSNIKIPIAKDPKNQPFTAFSFQRFLIPEIQKFSGKAIYLDSDMIVFQDIKKLWEIVFEGAELLSLKQFKATLAQHSVLLIDCEKLKWDIKEIIKQLDQNIFSYRELMQDLIIAKNKAYTIPEEWNSLENFEKEKTALLHFTKIHTQPWLSTKNPLSYLWFQLLFEAIDKNIVSLDLIKEHIKAGFIRPSLVWQIENRVEDSQKIPSKIIQKLDNKFVNPLIKKLPILTRAKLFLINNWENITLR